MSRENSGMAFTDVDRIFPLSKRPNVGCVV